MHPPPPPTTARLGESRAALPAPLPLGLPLHLPFPSLQGAPHTFHMSRSPACSRFLLLPSPPAAPAPAEGGSDAAPYAWEMQTEETWVGVHHGWGRWLVVGVCTGQEAGECRRKRRSQAFPLVTQQLAGRAASGKFLFESFPLGDGNSPRRFPVLPVALGAGCAFTGLLRGWDGVFKAKKGKMSPHARAEHALSAPVWGLCLSCTHMSAVRLLPCVHASSEVSGRSIPFFGVGPAVGGHQTPGHPGFSR